MGKVASRLIRPARTFNIENRAHRAIEKHKTRPITAPKHPTTVDRIKKIQADNPEWLEEQKMKHEGLDERLKGMIVQPDRLEEVKPIARSLPEDRRTINDPEFGYLEPAVIQPGHFSIRQALEFITRHQENPSTCTAATIATEYNLHEEDVHHVLRYFHTLQIQVPREVLDKLPPGDTLMKTRLQSGDTKPS